MTSKINLTPKTMTLVIFIAICLGIAISYQPYIGLIMIVGIVFAFIAAKYTFHSFLFGLCLIIFEGSISSFSSDELIQNIIGAIPELIFAYIFVVVLYKKKFKIFKLNFFDYFLFLIIAWSTLVSINGVSSVFMYVFGFRVLFRFLLIYWIIRIWNFKSEELLNKIAQFLVTMIFIEFIISLAQLIGKMAYGAAPWNTFGNNLIMSSSTFGVQGTFNRYDMFGMFMGFSAIVVLGYYYFYNQKKLYLLAYAISLICVFFSTSRQAIVISIIGTVILIISPLNKSIKIKFTIIAGYILIIGGLLAFLVMPHLGKVDGSGRNPLELLFSLFDGSTYNTDKTKNFRLYFIIVIGKWLIDNHLWGMGLGTFGANFSLEQFKDLYLSLGLNDNFLNYISDVNWISVLGQIGVIGLISWGLFLISFFVKSLRDGFKQKDGLLLIAAAITIAWAISGLFGPNFEIKSNAMFFWMFFGLALNKGRKSEKND